LKDIAIIQAGGLGMRMGRHTRNKPKCLVPHMGRTILENNLFHLSSYKVYVIVDHLGDLVETYLKDILKRSDVEVVRAPEKSTTSGVKEIMSANPDSRFVVIWSDLYLSADPGMADSESILVGVTNDFKCRWSVRDGELLRETTGENGVMGIFWFPNSFEASDFDSSKSLVGGNLARLKVPFEKRLVDGVVEIGDAEEYERMVESGSKTRFFNSVQICGDYVEKRCVDPAFSHLIEDEKRWYAHIGAKCDFVPRVLSLDPFRIQRIEGSSPHLVVTDEAARRRVVELICDSLSNLHSIESRPCVYSDYEDVYVAKTLARVDCVSSLIPFFNRRSIKINGFECLNPFHESAKDNFTSEIRTIFGRKYRLVHGDPTFSNIIVRPDLKPFLIDPRGRFGGTVLYGDAFYDWAKLYYSVSGNYDSVNRKAFEVRLGDGSVDIDCESNGYESQSPILVERSGMEIGTMRLLHSLIWMSLTGYVREDVDSVMYSFYKGVFLWNEIPR
jgi:GTP:adenosylcobinamide-phosphate guanylyltransferase